MKYRETIALTYIMRGLISVLIELLIKLLITHLIAKMEEALN